MRKLLIFAVALVGATILPAAASRAGDANLDQMNDQLNPQPLPPGDKLDPAATGQHIPKVQLNPQPLPPGMQSPDQTELNPQPLPPGAK